MADLIDHASDREQIDNDNARAQQASRAAKYQRPEALGYCLVCFEDFDGDMGRLFCNDKCARQFRQ